MNVLTYETRINSFREKLDKLCDTRTPNQVLMKITPQMAAAMLERNRDNNRPVSARSVEGLVAAIKGGRLPITHQGIAFDWNGGLLDGQHRLHAIVVADAAVHLWVAFGLDPAAFAHIDRGRVRTSGQILYMAGFSDTNILAAAARMAILVIMGDIYMPNATDAAQSIRAKWKANEPSPDIILDFVRENEDFATLNTFHGIYKQFPPAGASISHAVHWLIKRKHPQLAAPFMEQVSLGEGLRRTDNVYRLRQHLQRAYERGNVISKTWRGVWLIDCFNATRAGKEIRSFQIKAGRDFPMVR